MSAIAKLRGFAGGMRRLFMPYEIPAELKIVMDELEARATEARDARQRLDASMAGVHSSIVASVLVAQVRLRGPRDV